MAMLRKRCFTSNSQTFINYMSQMSCNVDLQRQVLGFVKNFSRELKVPPYATTNFTKIMFVSTPGHALVTEGKFKRSARGYKATVGVADATGHYVLIQSSFFKVDRHGRLAQVYSDAKYRGFEQEPSEDVYLGE